MLELEDVGVPVGTRPWLAVCVAGITYTLPESESANTRDSVTCTFVIFYDTPPNHQPTIRSKMVAANVGTGAPSLAMSAQAFYRLRQTQSSVQTVGDPRTHRPTDRHPLVRRHTQRA